MSNPNVLRNKYHGCIVQQALTDKGWDISLYRELPEGGEQFVQKCDSLAEAIAMAKKIGVVSVAVQPPLTGTSEEQESQINVAVEVEK